MCCSPARFTAASETTRWSTPTGRNPRFISVAATVLIRTVYASPGVCRWRFLRAEGVTGEVLAMIDRIIVYNQEHINIRFAFGESNL